MNRKHLRIGAALLASCALMATEAHARVCLLRSSSGSCTFWSGSTDCEGLSASGVGNVKKVPQYMACAVEPAADSASVPGLVYCSNGGGNVAPGVQAFLSTGFTGFSTINPSQVTKNGNAYGINVKSQASDIQLRQLDQFCQNANWYAVDFVPSTMSVTVQLLDGTDTVLDSTQYACSLPQPETLGWDFKAGHPERRQYNCQ